jgi:hypothetical protein
MPSIPAGSVVIRIHLFHSAAEEIRRAIAPPWPRTIRRLYELESIGESDVDPGGGGVSVSAAISAVDTLLHHRLDIIAWVVSAMEELGWEMAVEGEHVIASKVHARVSALEELELNGVLGPLCKVCDLDENGAPVMLDAWEARSAGA